jgi:hypothetical protein
LAKQPLCNQIGPVIHGGRPGKGMPAFASGVEYDFEAFDGAREHRTAQIRSGWKVFWALDAPRKQ